MGLAYFEKGGTVMIPYLCIRVNCTIKSSFRWIGIGRFSLKIAPSSFGVGFTLKSVFIPISFLCLASQSYLRAIKLTTSQSIHSSYTLSFRFDQEKTLLYLSKKYRRTRFSQLEGSKANFKLSNK